jgi:hypothetical protein
LGAGGAAFAARHAQFQRRCNSILFNMGFCA